MSHQYIDICFTKDQAAYRQAEHASNGHKDIEVSQATSVSVAEAQGTVAPYDFDGKYYQQSVQGALFIVMAQVG
ncbi:MAG: hypothetical protein ABSH14_16355 [Verrucomicrobiia bacterium]